MITLSKKKLRQELVVWQRRRAQLNGWPEYEGIGRLLYWLGEPDSSTYLRHAAHAYVSTDSSAYALLTAGNLLRLAGDAQHAQALWTQSYEQLLPTIADQFDLDLQTMVSTCFFLERYDEAQTFAHQLAARTSNPNLRAFTIGRLAQAQQAPQEHQRAEILRIAEHFAERIRVTRSKIAHTGQISLWDWYEIALRRAQDLGADLPEGALPLA